MYPCSLILNPKHSDHVKCKSVHSFVQNLPMDSHLTCRKKKKRQTYILTIAYKFSSDIPYSPQPYHSLTLFPTTHISSHALGVLLQHGFCTSCFLCWACSSYTICMGSFLPSEDLCSNVTCSMSTSLSNCKVNLYSLGIP